MTLRKAMLSINLKMYRATERQMQKPLHEKQKIGKVWKDSELNTAGFKTYTI